MTLRFLKIATAFASCWIIVGGDVLGGPLWTFVLLGLISKQWKSILFSIAFIGVIYLFAKSAFNNSRKWDLPLFLIGGVAIDFCSLLFQGSSYPLVYFLITLGIFNTLWLVTVYFIYKK